MIQARLSQMGHQAMHAFKTPTLLVEVATPGEWTPKLFIVTVSLSLVSSQITLANVSGRATLLVATPWLSFEDKSLIVGDEFSHVD